MPFDNDERYARAEYLILASLEKKSMGFDELETSAGVSSRTLTKHLRVLVPKMVEKVGKSYGLTKDGESRVMNLRDYFNDLRKKGGARGYPIDRLDVDIISDKCDCHGVLTGFSRSRLSVEQRTAANMAITELIKNLMGSIPTGSNWKLHMIWRNRP